MFRGFGSQEAPLPCAPTEVLVGRHYALMLKVHVVITGIAFQLTEIGSKLIKAIRMEVIGLSYELQ